MKLICGLLVALIFLAQPAPAQIVFVDKPNPVKDFFKHYWEPTLLTAGTFAARYWNARSSVDCQRRNCGVETNPTLGPHPTPGATYGYALGSAALLGGLNFTFHWLTRKYHAEDLQPLEPLWNVPLWIMDGLDTHDNYAIPGNLKPPVPHYRK